MTLVVKCAEKLQALVPGKGWREATVQKDADEKIHPTVLLRVRGQTKVFKLPWSHIKPQTNQNNPSMPAQKLASVPEVVDLTLEDDDDIDKRSDTCDDTDQDDNLHDTGAVEPEPPAANSSSPAAISQATPPPAPAATPPPPPPKQPKTTPTARPKTQFNTHSTAPVTIQPTALATALQTPPVTPPAVTHTTSYPPPQASQSNARAITQATITGPLTEAQTVELRSTQFSKEWVPARAHIAAPTPKVTATSILYDLEASTDVPRSDHLGRNESSRRTHETNLPQQPNPSSAQAHRRNHRFSDEHHRHPLPNRSGNLVNDDTADRPPSHPPRRKSMTNHGVPERHPPVITDPSLSDGAKLPSVPRHQLPNRTAVSGREDAPEILKKLMKTKVQKSGVNGMPGISNVSVFPPKSRQFPRNGRENCEQGTLHNQIREAPPRGTSWKKEVDDQRKRNYVNEHDIFSEKTDNHARNLLRCAEGFSSRGGMVVGKEDDSIITKAVEKVTALDKISIFDEKTKKAPLQFHRNPKRRKLEKPKRKVERNAPVSPLVKNSIVLQNPVGPFKAIHASPSQNNNQQDRIKLLQAERLFHCECGENNESIDDADLQSTGIIQCGACGLWSHRRCVKLSQTDEKKQFLCWSCLGTIFSEGNYERLKAKSKLFAVQIQPVVSVSALEAWDMYRACRPQSARRQRPMVRAPLSIEERKRKAENVEQLRSGVPAVSSMDEVTARDSNSKTW